LVKIISASGNEEKFDSKDVENELKADGLPDKVAEEVAERVEDRIEDRWTAKKVNEQIDIELNRLEEDIKRAHNSFKEKTVAREMPIQENMPHMTSSGHKETFIPETQRERHLR